MDYKQIHGHDVCDVLSQEMTLHRQCCYCFDSLTGRMSDWCLNGRSRQVWFSIVVITFASGIVSDLFSLCCINIHINMWFPSWKTKEVGVNFLNNPL